MAQRTIFAAILLACFNGMAAAQSPNAAILPTCYVIAAGIDQYPARSNLKIISGAVNDARDLISGYKAQQGSIFQQIVATTLLDGDATTPRIKQKLKEIRTLGKAGDVIVFLLSGHGGRFDQSGWLFCPYDYLEQNEANTSVYDRDIIDAVGAAASGGRKVIVILDACFAGRLKTSAGPTMSKFKDVKGGGIVLMMSSGPDQVSQALGPYGAFARAVLDSVNGGADLNKDGRITLNEVKKTHIPRTQQLLKRHQNKNSQEGDIVWSPSFHSEYVLGLVQSPRVYSGSEDGENGKKMPFKLQLYPGGRAVAHAADVNVPTEGTWNVNGNRLTMRFDFNGLTTYTGAVNGSSIAGNAVDRKDNWNWRVESVSAPRPTVVGAPPIVRPPVIPKKG